MLLSTDAVEPQGGDPNNLEGIGRKSQARRVRNAKGVALGTTRGRRTEESPGEREEA